MLPNLSQRRLLPALRRVALKILAEHLASEPERRERLRREARAVASLNHPNIVTLHSVEELETLLSIPTTFLVATLEGSALWDDLRDLPRYRQLIEKYQ